MFIPLIIIKYYKHFNILCPKIAKIFTRQKKICIFRKVFSILFGMFRKKLLTINIKNVYLEKN